MLSACSFLTINIHIGNVLACICGRVLWRERFHTSKSKANTLISSIVYTPVYELHALYSIRRINEYNTITAGVCR